MALQLFKIASTTVESPVATIQFDSIPSGYTDLKLLISARENYAAVATTVYVRFNNDSGANYSRRRLVGSGSSTASYSATGETWVYLSASAPGTTATSSTFGNIELYIPNYTSSNAKSLSADTVSENNATEAYATLQASLWSGTSTISSITLGSDGNFVANSTFTLYGVL